MFAGINGVGKSTLYNLLSLKEKAELGVRIDVGDDEDEAKATRAQLIADRCLADEKTFNMESSLSGTGIEDLIKRARDRMYFIVLKYVSVTNLEILAERLNVPLEKLDAQYSKSLENFMTIGPLCNEVEIFDNSQALACIALFENGKCRYAAKVLSIPIFVAVEEIERVGSA